MDLIEGYSEYARVAEFILWTVRGRWSCPSQKNYGRPGLDDAAPILDCLDVAKGYGCVLVNIYSVAKNRP